MKTSALAFVFAMAATGAAMKITPRQAPKNVPLSFLGSGNINTLPKQKANKIEEIKAVNPGAKRLRMIYGPYKLRAANSTVKMGNGKSMDTGGTSYSAMVDEDFPKDITVLEGWADTYDENMKRTDTKDGIYNRHVLFVDFSKPLKAAYTCESGKGPPGMPVSILTGGITENTVSKYGSVDSEVKTGYYLSKDRKLLKMVDVVNYNNVERSVYIYSEIEYLPGKPEGYIDTNTQLLNPGMCGGQQGSAIHLPKGVQKFQVNSTGIIAASDGYIVDMMGHLHDGGVNIVVQVNGKEVCNSKALYGGEGHTGSNSDGKLWETIRETTKCGGVRVKKGDKLFMQGNYDLDLHPAR